MGRNSKLLLAALLIAGGLLTTVTASAAPSGFTGAEPVWTGLDLPTNIEFAPDGRVFIIEKKGVIKTADSINDSTLSQVTNLQSQVHNFWDRGLLGLAVHPQFPNQPYLYILYTYGAPLPVTGGPTRVWEEGTNDNCPTPPGSTDQGCVVSGRLSRLQLNPATMQVVSETVLIHDWCQQFPSHSIGDLQFGADGKLYVSGGDGASFTGTDWGQFGGNPGTVTPRNPCGDPPVGAGQNMPTNGTAEGGALRAQDLRTSGDPVTLSGTVIRIEPLGNPSNPATLVPADNPNASHPDPRGKLVVAHGLRNPYRFTFRPGTNDLYIGDVGWDTWEEVNRHSNPSGSVRNYGWPCYEGGYSNGAGSSMVLGNYSNFDICRGLGTGAVNAPLFAYHHGQTITHPTNDDCPPAVPGPTTRTSSSITGLAFYATGPYPPEYDGALFGADYSRNCIWVMYRGSGGVPDPDTVEVFHYGPPTSSQQGLGPVDIEMGPDGNIYVVSLLRGQVVRFRYIAANTPPTARITANPTSGPAPLTVNFSGTTSSDPDGDAIVEYAWDFTNNGTFDAFGANVSFTYQQPGSYTARLRVTDSRGETGTTTVGIQASNGPPQPTINNPSSTLQWSVGQQISFSGSAADPEEGTLPASRLSWSAHIFHCAEDGSCHEHPPFFSASGVSSGSFTAPDHEYPSHIVIRLTARDQFGVETTVSRQIQPRTAQLTFSTSPGGRQLSIGGSTVTAPITKTFIVGSTVSISAPTPQGSPSTGRWHFSSWSQGGAATQTFAAPATNTTYTANFVNREPSAVISAIPTGGSIPLTVQFDGSGSSDPDGDNLAYAWDLDGDGAHDDSTAVSPTRTYTTPTPVTVSLRVTDPTGKTGIATVTITPGNDPPQPVITTPSSGLLWSVGQQITFSGSATDPQDGSIPASGLGWIVNLRNCPTCAPQTIATASGASGSFTTPSAGPEAVIEIRLTATDSHGGSTSAVRTISPRTVDLTFDTTPSGLTLSIAGVNRVTPFTGRWIVGTPIPVEAISPQVFQGEGGWTFASWAHGAARAHTITAPASETTYIAEYARVKDQPPLENPFHDDDGSIFEEDIEWLAAMGITRGCNPPVNDMFCPDQPVTRGQMAAFFVRALGLSGSAGADAFVDDHDHLFEREIEIVAAAGITRGCNPPANDRFCPDDPITRGQVAAFFVRALQLKAGAGDDLFVDDDGHLFERELDLLGTSGIVRGCNPPANDRACPDALVTRGQMAAFFHRAAPWLP